MQNRKLAAVVAVALVASVAGCGGDEPAAAPASMPASPSGSPSIAVSPTPSPTPTPTAPPGNTVTLSCTDQSDEVNEVTITPGPKGLPDFTAAWALKLRSCDVVGGDFGGSEKVLPITAVEKGVYRASRQDGYDEEDEDIAFFYRDCAAVDPDDTFNEPGSTLSTEQIPDMIATLMLCPKHPHAANWRAALKRGQGEVQLEKSGRIFGAGTYRVGKDIKPGIYVARDVDGCYWERQSRNGDIIDNSFINGAKRVQVTIRSSDYGFHTTGCGTWRRA